MTSIDFWQTLSQRCLVIGEVAQSHDGSLGQAHAFIDAIARAGADAVNFQTHFATDARAPGEPGRVHFGPQDANCYDYWRRMEFTPEQWKGLKRHADQVGLFFLSSPFSIEAVELLDRTGIVAWKIALGEVSNPKLFERMASTGLPILLSTRMSPVSEMDAAVAQVRARALSLAILHCTSAYPCSPEKVGLKLLPFFKQRYGCAVGLSDHSGTVFPALAAATIGIQLVELHVTLSREMFGPDIRSSVTTAELHQVVEGIRFVERMMSSLTDQEPLIGEWAPLRRLSAKSTAARLSDRFSNRPRDR